MEATSPEVQIFDVYPMLESPSRIPGLKDGPLRRIFGVAVDYGAQAVMAAELLGSDRSGAEKKKWAVDQVMAQLEALEEEHDVVPDWLEWAGRKGARIAMNFVVERVFQAATDAGLIDRLEKVV